MNPYMIVLIVILVWLGILTGMISILIYKVDNLVVEEEPAQEPAQAQQIV